MLSTKQLSQCNMLHTENTFAQSEFPQVQTACRLCPSLKASATMVEGIEGMLIAVTQLQLNGMTLGALTMMTHTIKTNINYKIKPVVQLPWQLDTLSVTKQGGACGGEGGRSSFLMHLHGALNSIHVKSIRSNVILVLHEPELSHCFDCYIYACYSHNQRCKTLSVEPSFNN